MNNNEEKLLTESMDALFTLVRGSTKTTREETYIARRDSDGVIEIGPDGSPIMILSNVKIKKEDVLPDEKTIHMVVKALDQSVFKEKVVDKGSKAFTITHEVHHKYNEDIPEGKQFQYS